MDDLQKDLEATYPVLQIQLVGVNAYGQESANTAATQGRELPWLQDVDANQDGGGDAAGLWNPSYRHVYILDGDNVQVAAFDVESGDLQDAENYAALRELLIDAAMTSQRPWRNGDNPLDVSDNGGVEPLDALIIINKLNAEGPHELPPPQAGDPPMRYYDCNGDGDVGPLDALNVINYLNAQDGEANAEGEGLPAEPVAWRADQPASSAVPEASPNATDPISGQTRQAGTETQDDLTPGREALPGECDWVWPSATSSRADAAAAEIPLRMSQPIEPWDGWLTVRAGDESLPETWDGKAAMDL